MDRAAHASPRMICIMAALLAFAATAPAHPILDTPDDRAEDIEQHLLDRDKNAENSAVPPALSGFTLTLCF